MDQKPWVVALTGGIASGKTAVSDRFGALGVPIIDTDLIAREIVQPGAPALAEIAATFGTDLIDETGALDRRALRRIIFSDQSAKKRLEDITHPRILETVKTRIAEIRSPYCIVVIPLLAEIGDMPDYLDHVLLVDVDEETQLGRLTRRDGVTRQQAEQALASQANRTQRLALADSIIHNDQGLNALNQLVEKLHARFLAEARSQKI